MSTPRLPLDVELAWEVPQGHPEKLSPRPPGTGRVWLALLADAGSCLAAFFFALALAAWQGASLSAPQLGVVAVFTSVIWVGAMQVGTLWCFAGTLGMDLVGLAFAAPLPLRRAWWLWLAFLASLPLLALPLCLGRPGARLVERLAGCELKLAGSPAVA